MRAPIIAAMLALAGCAASSEMQASQQAEARNDLASALGDRVPGTPRDCISVSDSDGPQIIDDRTIGSGVPGPVTAEVRTLFEGYVESYLES